jgi:hypothetical protein
MKTQKRQQERKLTQREQLFPLIRELATRVNTLGLRTEDLIERTGLPDYQISRILNASTGTPNWVEMTQVIVAVGLSPNEAAQLAGIYHGEFEENLGLPAGPYDRELLTLIHDPLLGATDREDIVRSFITFLSLEKEARLRRLRLPIAVSAREPVRRQG